MYLGRTSGCYVAVRTTSARGYMIFKRVLTVLVAAVLSSFFVGSAEAAEAAPLDLTSYAIAVWSPVAPASACDTGSQLNCGAVAVDLTFSGLTGRSRSNTRLYDGELSGTVHVVRTYGCQSAKGKRLKRYDLVVREDAFLATRRSMPYKLPTNGDSFSRTVYAFLSDAQPGNCPANTRAMTYKIKARRVHVTLTSYLASIPSANYSAPGRAIWKGAVPTPTNTTTS